MRDTAWLRDIPDGWDIRRFSWLGRMIGGGTPSKSEPDYWNGEIPWVSPKDMKSRRILDTEDHISERGVRHSSTNVVPPNTVLIVTRSGILRHSLPVGIATRPMALNQDMKGVMPADDVVADYVAYWMEANQSLLLSLWRKEGTTVESLETDLIRQTPVPLPPFRTQRAIASFLDRETEKIDTLIEKKRRLLELLEEKRTALITRAVTKGLDPDVPMKDSGVEWIGEIPEHWEATRLRHLTKEVTVGVVVQPSQYYASEGVPFLRSLNVREMKLNPDNLVFISGESNRRLRKTQVASGDLVAVRTGQPGKTAVVDAAFDGANCIDLLIIRQSPLFISEFLGFFMNSLSAKQQYLLGGEGAIQTHFNVETAKDLLVPVPPLGEQARIVEALHADLDLLRSLRRRITQAISLLEEYRTALISAAVTGKIDVRDKAPPDPPAPLTASP